MQVSGEPLPHPPSIATTVDVPDLKNRKDGMKTCDQAPARRLILLGSTGSIGINTIEVVRHLASLPEEHRRTHEVIGLAAGSRAVELEEQARLLGVDDVALANPEQADQVSSDRRLRTGPDAARQLVKDIARKGDMVVAAMVGAAGIPAILDAIEIGCDIALANKETLVSAGDIVTRAARKSGSTILPVDSEHSAIHQALTAGNTPGEVSRLVLTASGGPFREWPAKQVAEATIEEALAHPTWNMGPKVTIDSASLMNKGLELIEAHWLFDMPADKLEAVIHPQSIVHSMVEFVDGSVIAQLSPPDMRMPIQHALTWPHRIEGSSPRLDLTDALSLNFEPIDAARFPAIELARQVIREGGTAGAVFNAANEAAVSAFLDGRISFGRLSELVIEAVNRIPAQPAESLQAIEAADQEARRLVGELVGMIPT